MQTCPHCYKEICIRTLRHRSLWKNYRVCPYCGGYFTVDTATKYRQALCLVAAVVSLVLTLLLYYSGTVWLIPALISYAVVGLIIYWGNKRLFLVPYQN